jgi:hypothetical protein
LIIDEGWSSGGISAEISVSKALEAARSLAEKLQELEKL